MDPSRIELPPRPRCRVASTRLVYCLIFVSLGSINKTNLKRIAFLQSCAFCFLSNFILRTFPTLSTSFVKSSCYLLNKICESIAIYVLISFYRSPPITFVLQHTPSPSQSIPYGPMNNIYYFNCFLKVSSHVLLVFRLHLRDIN